MTVPKKEKVVLLVEDNPADERLAREALASRNERVRIECVGDGEEALLFLLREGPYSDAPVPDLIMLDLGLPRKRGEQVLKAIRSDAENRNTPVVVLTGSATGETTDMCYALGANCVVPKGSDLDEQTRALNSTCDFWLGVARLPRGRQT